MHNRTLYIHDNLDILRGMNSESVDLIATDPPFNKGRDFHATPDSLAAGARFQDRWSWETDVHPDWVDSIKDDQPALYELIDLVKNGQRRDDLAAFLCWLGVRAIEMRRALKPTAAFTYTATLRHLTISRLCWTGFSGSSISETRLCGHTGKCRTRRASFSATTIRYFSKTDSHTFNRQYEEYAASSKRTYERAEKIGYNANIKKGMATVWDWGKYNDAVAQGKLPSGLNAVEFKKTGAAMRAVWDIPILSPTSKERVGYPTQKPVALYKRIIKASSNEGDLALDPFCGCSTTLVAAEALKRHWIGIDLWEGAATTLQERIESPVYTRCTPCEPTKKRMSALTCRVSIGGSAKPNLGGAYHTPICARYPTPRGAAYARDAGGSFTFGLCS